MSDRRRGGQQLPGADEGGLEERNLQYESIERISPPLIAESKAAGGGGKKEKGIVLLTGHPALRRLGGKERFYQELGHKDTGTGLSRRQAFVA